MGQYILVANMIFLLSMVRKFSIKTFLNRQNDLFIVIVETNVYLIILVFNMSKGNDGSVKWKYTFSTLDSYVLSSPAIGTNGIVVFGVGYVQTGNNRIYSSHKKMSLKDDMTTSNCIL